MWAASTWISSSPTAGPAAPSWWSASPSPSSPRAGRQHGQRRARPPMRTVRPSRLTAVPLCICRTSREYSQRMPRAIWSGAISFGLVNIPIKLYAAVSRKNVSFNQLDSPHRGRASSTRRCPPPTAKRCRPRRSSRATSCSSGAYVTVGDDELAVARPRGEPHDRHRGVRRPGRHRPALLRLRLLRRARQGDHQALRPAHPGDGGVGQGGHRPLRDALEAVPLRRSARRTARSCCRRWSTPTR